MKDKDIFKNWLQDHLQEEVEGIHFSDQSKRKVRTEIMKEAEIDVKKESWWNKKLSLSWAAAAVCIVIFVFSIGFYTRTFFYVSEQEIAQYETHHRMIIHQEDIPFGAIQQIAEIPQGYKGAGK